MTHRRRLAVCTIVAATLVVSTVGMAPHARTQTEPEREIAVVLRVSLPEAFDLRGRAVASVARHLERLTDQLAALRDDELDAVPYGLSFAGVVCDELRVLDTPPARRLIRELELQARTSTVLSSTHADVRLSDIRRSEIATEVDDGQAAIEACTGTPPRSLFVPPDLTLPDAGVLKPLRAEGAVVALSAFAVPLAPGRPTIVPAVELPPKPDLESLLSARPESPSIAVVINTSVHDVASVLRDLSDDKRFALRNVGALAKLDVVRGVIDPDRRAPRGWRSAISQAAGALETYESFTLPDNRLAAVYATVIARLRGSAAWGPEYDVATRRARAVEETLEAQQDLVSVPDGSVTFTSSRGRIPVTITNRADYPVRVRLELSSSPKLRFPPDETNCPPPRETNLCRVITVDPPGDQITFGAIARSTGAFPTSISLKGYRRELVLDTANITVRSQGANVSAVVLTAGGAIFLIVWFLRRLSQRRRDEAS